MELKSNTPKSLGEKGTDSCVSPYTKTGGLSWTVKSPVRKSCLVFNFELQVRFVQRLPDYNMGLFHTSSKIENFADMPICL